MTDTGKKIPLIGILGGIGSGKSTVAGYFAKLGCAVIDADTIAHEVLETTEVQGILAHRFGAAVFTADGHVNRKALASIVFSDPAKLAFLNSIVHPRTLQRVQESITDIRQNRLAKAIIIDAPLLVEAGWDKKCDNLVFVECNKDYRLSRLLQRSGIDRKQLEEREKFQISLDKKASLAYYTISNNSDLSALEGQVSCVFSRISGGE
jgi:dephospho-CoA kinase